MDTILGFLAIYTWVHSAVIVFKKTKALTWYEQAVLIAGFVFLGLILIGIAAS